MASECGCHTLLFWHVFFFLFELVCSHTLSPGPISVVIHIDHSPDVGMATSPVKILQTLRASNRKVREQVDVHLITTPATHRQSNVNQQGNLHRNIARFFARTDYVLLLDADGALPVTDVTKSFALYPGWMEKLRTGNVFVLPGFTVSMTPVDQENPTAELVPALSQAALPADKTTLLENVRDGSIVLSEKTWKRTIRNVDYSTWATQTHLSAIQNYDPYFSPSVVIRRDKMLWCPERFGDNHAACMFELYLSGADFWVLPSDFTVNAGTRREVQVTEREVSLVTPSLNNLQKFTKEPNSNIL